MKGGVDKRRGAGSVHSGTEQMSGLYDLSTHTISALKGEVTINLDKYVMQKVQKAAFDLNLTIATHRFF